MRLIRSIHDFHHLFYDATLQHYQVRMYDKPFNRGAINRAQPLNNGLAMLTIINALDNVYHEWPNIKRRIL